MTITPLDESLLAAPTSLGSQVIEVLKAFTPEGDFVASEVTDEAFKWMEESEPQLLEDWTREVARQTMRSYFRSHQLRERARWARSTRGRTFRAATDEAEETGDFEPLTAFSLSYVVNEQSLRRRVPDMTAEDHRFVATKYEQSADRILMLSAFHREIAKHIPEGATTADIMDEETYSRIYASIVK